MVKLIRITTRATDGSFETAFRSPVNIKENSKVALQNLIMAVQEKAIIIDGTNDQMFFFRIWRKCKKCFFDKN